MCVTGGSECSQHSLKAKWKEYNEGKIMIKRIFITGIQAFVPIAVTFALVVWIFTTIEKFMGEFLKYFIKQEYYFNGLGILVGIAIIFLIGILVNAWVIKKIYALAD